MYDSMLRCIISEDMDAADFSKEFDEVRGQGKRFLPGAKVVLDFGARPLSEGLIRDIMTDLVWPAGMYVAAWITYDAATQDLLKRIGLPTSEPSPSARANESAKGGSLLLQRSLRSGQRVEHAGDVIVAGHVNDGAEVLAAGHVTVLGRLNGLVHAGYNGDETASVAVRSMEARQVRIGTKIGSLDRDERWWGKMVIVRVNEGSVFIDYWPVIKSDSRDESAGARSAD
jgi:septum site-determining protein MinC